MKLKIGLFIAWAILWTPTIQGQVVINPATEYQTIEGFAASDCWTLQYVGESWSAKAKEDIARYLFSQEVKSDGSPEGIGLSMWRVNLGAGTREQGEESYIFDAGRRAECFLDETGENYDWNKQAGQQWFIERAKEYGCDNFVAFSNSPPVFYTKNGKGFSNGDSYSNLREDAYGDFANYLTTVLKHFQDKGIEFKYVSPVNEPQYAWTSGNDGDGGQEGSPWHNSEISKIARELDKSIQEKNVNAKILIAEAGDWTYLYNNNHRWAGNQIYEFFDKRSENYIGDLPSLANVIAGHSYWTESSSNADMKSVRTQVYTQAKSYGINVFQTEWSMMTLPPASMGFPDTSGNKGDNFSYIDVALSMGKLIYSDLVHARVTSWSYWTAVSQERWSHKNRFYLVRITPETGDYGDPWVPGSVSDNAKLWALGNYSFFVRPGYKRIGLTGAAEFDTNGLMGTAYLAPDNSRIVAVYVNMSSNTKTFTTSFKNLDDFIPVANNMYVTSGRYNLQKIKSFSEVYDPEREISVPARSITTIVYDLEPNGTGINKVTDLSNSIQSIYDSVSNNLKLIFPSEMIQDKAFVNMYSVNGNKIFSSERIINSTEEHIALNQQIPQGVYVLNITVGKERVTKKVIVK